MPGKDYRDMVVATDAETAAEFLQTWFGSLPEGSGADGKRVVSLFSLPSRAARHFPLTDLLERIEDGWLDEAVYPTNGGPVQNVYHTNALFGTIPERGRGRVNDISIAPGFWLDIDVKDGAFGSQDEIRNFAWGPMTDAGLKPSILVNSGTGCHAYWLTEDPLDADEMRELGERVWMWTEKASGHKLDNLSDPARVFRLPGTVWFGKGEGGVLSARPVTTQWCKGTRISKTRVREITGNAWDEYETERKRIRAERRRADKQALKRWEPQMLGLPGSWAYRAALEAARQVFPARITWAQILEPAGWTQYGHPDDEGHVMWTRPHAEGEKVNPRSLVVDWDESPNVASLLSDSEKTGLSRLVKAGIPLTKLEVFAELYYGGSKTAALLDFIAVEQEGGEA